MSDNRKYYYLKLKENYFDDDSIVLLESMQDGVLYSNILLKLYAGALGHALQGAVLVLDAHAACHAAILGQGVLQQIADHAVAVEIIIGMGGQIVIHYLKSLHPIVIVGIDDSKRSINRAVFSLL